MSNCEICKQPIKVGALKCRYCQSHLNWKSKIGDLTVINAITLISTVVAIAIGFYQLSGVGDDVKSIEKENKTLVQSNKESKIEISRLGTNLETVNSNLETRKVEAKRFANALKAQQEYIKSLEGNIKGLSDLIEAKQK